MTVTDIRPSNSIEFEIDNTSSTALAALDPERPVYLVADNPWTPWAARTGGAAIGVILAAVETIALAKDVTWWPLAFAVTFALLFAWVCAGHELFERRPTRFKKAP